MFVFAPFGPIRLTKELAFFRGSTRADQKIDLLTESWVGPANEATNKEYSILIIFVGTQCHTIEQT